MFSILIHYTVDNKYDTNVKKMPKSRDKVNKSHHVKLINPQRKKSNILGKFIKSINTFLIT